ASQSAPHANSVPTLVPLISVPTAWVAISVSTSSAPNFCMRALYELPFDKTAKAPILLARDCQGVQPALPTWIIIVAAPLTWLASLSTTHAPARLACMLAAPEASLYICGPPSLAWLARQDWGRHSLDPQHLFLTHSRRVHNRALPQNHSSQLHTILTITFDPKLQMGLIIYQIEALSEPEKIHYLWQ
ncbi:unnamed protein product, partial [Ilex paraguariensis]